MKKILRSLVILITCLSVSLLHAQSFPTLPDYLTADVKNVEQVLEYYESRLDHAVFEPAALAEKLGPDPTVVGQWVADNVSYRPYWGTIRGARGVLADRVANSLDRVILSGDLLAQHSVETRIGHSILTQEAIEKMAILAQAPLQPVPSAVTFDAKMIAAAVSTVGIDPAQLQADIQKDIETAEFQIAENAQVLNDFADAAASLISPYSTQDSYKTDPAKHAEFFWLEVKGVLGDWIVVDTLPVSLADLEVDRSAATYFAGPSNLPEKLMTWIEVSSSLKLETQDGGTETVELSRTKQSASEAAFAPLVLTSQPLSPENDRLITAETSVLPDQMQFSEVRGTAPNRFNYDKHGRLFRTNGPAEASGGALSQISDLLTEGVEGAANSESATQRLVNSLMVEVVVTESRGLSNPPKIERHVRKALEVDGPDRGFGEAWEFRLRALPYAVSPSYLDYRTIESTLWLMTNLLFALRTGTAKSSGGTSRGLMETGPAMSTSAMAFSVEGAENSWSDGTSILIEEGRIQSIDPETYGMYQGVDIMRIAQGGELSGAAVGGLAWTAAEAQVLTLGGEGNISGAALTTQDLNGSERSILLPAGQAIPDTLPSGFTDHDVEQLRFANTAGLDAILISGTELWFSHDPENGLWVGRGAGGRGQGSAERAEMEARIWDATRTLIEFGLCLGIQYQNGKLNDLSGGGACVLGAFLNGLAMWKWWVTMIQAPTMMLVCASQISISDDLYFCFAAFFLTGIAGVAGSGISNPKTASDALLAVRAMSMFRTILAVLDFIRPKK